MNYTDYTKMTSAQLAEEIAKQKEKIKKINDIIAVLKKLKIAEDFLESEKNNRTDKPKTEQSNTSTPTVNQTIKQQPQQKTSQQHQQQQKPKSGGVFNGLSSKIRT